MPATSCPVGLSMGISSESGDTQGSTACGLTIYIVKLSAKVFSADLKLRSGGLTRASTISSMLIMYYVNNLVQESKQKCSEAGTSGPLAPQKGRRALSL